MKLQDGRKGGGLGKEVVATTSGSSGTSNDITEKPDVLQIMRGTFSTYPEH